MAWLRQQADFPGRIRDRAGDVVADPATASVRSANRVRRYLEGRGVPANVLATLQEAETVWQVTYGAADARRRQRGDLVHYHGAEAR
jgi:hypothetical protein